MDPLTIPVGLRHLVVRRASVEQIVPLRHRILRAGLPVEEAHFAGDAEPSTCHAAAFDGDAALGCATFVLNAWEGEPAWQLRGMATDALWQGKGIGEEVLGYAIQLALEASPARLLWCNARIGALRFYQRLGWKIRSEEFEIPTAGTHRRLTRRV